MAKSQMTSIDRKEIETIARAIFDELSDKLRQEMKIVAKAMFDELKTMQKEQQVVYDKKTGRIDKIVTKINS